MISNNFLQLECKMRILSIFFYKDNSLVNCKKDDTINYYLMGLETYSHT